MYPGYSKRAFDGLVTYDETWVYWCSNRVWATRNGRCHIIAKQPRTFKTIMQVIFYCNSKVLSKRCIKKIKKNLPNPPPHNRLNHLRLLHDNTPAHKVRIVTEFFFLIREHQGYLTPLLPRPCPLQLFPVSKTNISSIWKQISFYKLTLICCLPVSNIIGLPVEEYENCLQKWIDCLKWCIQIGGEDFVGQAKKN